MNEFSQSSARSRSPASTIALRSLIGAFVGGHGTTIEQFLDPAEGAEITMLAGMGILFRRHRRMAGQELASERIQHGAPAIQQCLPTSNGTGARGFLRGRNARQQAVGPRESPERHLMWAQHSEAD